MASVTEQQLNATYIRITNETSTRFDEGASKLEQSNTALMAEIAGLKQEVDNPQQGTAKGFPRPPH